MFRIATSDLRIGGFARRGVSFPGTRLGETSAAYNWKAPTNVPGLKYGSFREPHAEASHGGCLYSP